jgi:hypothetical protein
MTVKHDVPIAQWDDVEVSDHGVGGEGALGQFQQTFSRHQHPNVPPGSMD